MAKSFSLYDLRFVSIIFYNTYTNYNNITIKYDNICDVVRLNYVFKKLL